MGSTSYHVWRSYTVRSTFLLSYLLLLRTICNSVTRPLVIRKGSLSSLYLLHLFPNPIHPYYLLPFSSLPEYTPSSHRILPIMSPRCPRSIFHPVPLEDRYLVYLKYHNDLDFNVVDLDLCPISYFILILINPFLFFSLRLKRFSYSRLPASRLLASVFGSFFGCRLDWIGCAIYNGRCCRL